MQQKERCGTERLFCSYKECYVYTKDVLLIQSTCTHAKAAAAASAATAHFAKVSGACSSSTASSCGISCSKSSCTTVCTTGACMHTYISGVRTRFTVYIV
jgi:hypothetical protein